MKKTILSLVIGLTVWTTSAFAGFNIMDLTNKSAVDDQLAPVVKILGTGMNTGIYAPNSGKFFSFGLQAQGTTFDKSGFFKDITTPVLPASFFGYAGARIPFIGVGAYIRYFSIAPFYKELPLSFLGFGASYDKNFLLLFNIKAVGSYNVLSVKPSYTQDLSGKKLTLSGDISMKSYSLNIYGTFTKIPLIKPFAFVGLSKNVFKVDGSISVAVGSATPYSIPVTSEKSPLYAHLGAGVSLFKILTVEASVLPSLSASLSVGFAL